LSWLGLLVATLARYGWVCFVSLRAEPARASAALGVASLVSGIGLLLLVTRALDPEKNMAPFIAAIEGELPAGDRIHAIGSDETLEAIVPFVTNRRVIGIDHERLRSSGADEEPAAVLVQSKGAGAAQADLGPRHVRAATRSFGPARWIGLWLRCDGNVASAYDPGGADEGVH
jgi:hypothetical protein